MAELPQGYHDIPEEDQKKAKAFFDRAKSVADAGQYEYAIEMFLQGLGIDPENTDAHQAMRDISLRRKASGGKDLGFFEKMKLKKRADDEHQNMLNAEKMLAYDPGNTDHMILLLQSAHRAGFYDTVLWIGPILKKANGDSRSPEFGKFQTLKDVYRDIKQWKLASDAAQSALVLRPDDMDLATEVKNLSAYHTMDEGKYGKAGSFRDSMRDSDRQQRLIDGDKDVRSSELMTRMINEAEAEWKAEPNEAGKLMKYVDTLVKSEQADFENKAIELLEREYERTRQFRFRQYMGRIRIAQMTRNERALRAARQAAPKDEAVARQYADYVRDRWREELKEYQLWSENYPTDMSVKFKVAERLFLLEQYSDAIPIFQQARNDPKYRHDAAIYLGRAFLEAGFTDESVDTLRAVIGEYQLLGDPKSIDMHYWYGRALEKKGDNLAAIKAFSQVAQWDFNYRDVQSRIKRIRG